MRTVVPSFINQLWKRLEQLLQAHMSALGMFAFIALRHTEELNRSRPKAVAVRTDIFSASSVAKGIHA
jgi:hypothetical protein